MAPPVVVASRDELDPKREARATPFDPAGTISSAIRDPLYQAIAHWSDRQQRGRLAYEAMLRHSAVATPFDALVAFLKSFKPIFRPQTKDPTARQRMLADFGNEQIRRLGSSGDSRQGYEKTIEWIGQGLEHGFSLADLEPTMAPFNGSPRIQINRIIPLPQASLDLGFLPLEEFGQNILGSVSDIRYRCFGFDPRGNIVAVKQYAGSGKPITWEGGDLNRILHFIHGGTEGNPYGKSVLFSAFDHWADLYTLELQEKVIMDAGRPRITVSYKTPDGRPSPELHKQVVEALTNPDSLALVAPDASFGSISPSNHDWFEQATQSKLEQRRYISNAILLAGALQQEGKSGTIADAGSIMTLFFKNIAPAILKEISSVLSHQMVRRLIDANWSKLLDEDYPILDFQMLIGDDLRAANSLLLQAMPFLGSDRLGEFYATMIPNFDAGWIPADHSESVAAKRQAAPTDGQPGATGTPGATGAGGKEPGVAETPPTSTPTTG